MLEAVLCSPAIWASLISGAAAMLVLAIAKPATPVPPSRRLAYATGGRSGEPARLFLTPISFRR